MDKSILPPQWSWVKLGDVYKIETGNTPPKKEADNYGNYIPFIKPPQLLNCIVTNGEESLSKKGAEKGRVLPADSILVSCIGNLGKIGLNKVPVAFNQQINALVNNSKIHSRFTFYFCQSKNFRNQLENVASATTIPIVNKSKFSQLAIPLPPLPEQKKIVEKIEELFSGLDSGVASLKKAKEQIKLYRQSVLTSAFNGKLIGNVNFDEQTGLPKGWKLLPLKNIVVGDRGGLKRGPFGSSIKKSFFVESGYKVYEQGNAINDDPYRGKYFINEEKYKELEAFKVLPGDLIVSCSGVTLGRITEIPKDGLPGVINQALLRIRLNKKIISTKFFIMLFRSHFFQKRIFQNSQGSAMPNLVGLKDFKEIDLIVPPLNHQSQIVEEIKKRFSEANNLEKAIDESLQKSEALRQSILKQAFEGRLL